MADNTTSNIIAGLAPVLNTINTSLSNIHHAVTNKTCDDELEKVNEKLLNFSNDLPKKFTSLKHLITSEKMQMRKRFSQLNQLCAHYHHLLPKVKITCLLLRILLPVMMVFVFMLLVMEQKDLTTVCVEMDVLMF